MVNSCSSPRGTSSFTVSSGSSLYSGPMTISLLSVGTGGAASSAARGAPAVAHIARPQINTSEGFMVRIPRFGCLVLPTEYNHGTAALKGLFYLCASPTRLYDRNHGI